MKVPAKLESWNNADTYLLVSVCTSVQQFIGNCTFWCLVVDVELNETEEVEDYEIIEIDLDFIFPEDDTGENANIFTAKAVNENNKDHILPKHIRCLSYTLSLIATTDLNKII